MDNGDRQPGFVERCLSALERAGRSYAARVGAKTWMAVAVFVIAAGAGVSSLYQAVTQRSVGSFIALTVLALALALLAMGAAAPVLTATERLGERYRGLLERHWLAALGMLVLGAGLSLFILYQAVTQTEAFTFIGFALLGSIAGAVALGAVAPLVAGIRPRSWFPAAASAVYTTGLIGAGVGLLAASSIALTTAGIAVAIVAHVALSPTWTESSGRAPLPWLIGGGVALAIGLPTAGSLAGKAFAIGAFIAIVGLAGIKYAAAAYVRNGQLSSRLALQLGLFATVLGALAAWAAGSVGTAVQNAGIVVTALSVAGIGAMDQVARRASTVLKVVLVLAGIISAAVGAFWINDLFDGWRWIAVLVGALAATIGAFYVFRGEAIVAMLVLGALFGWVLVDRDSTPPDFTSDRPLIVAFGDSFTAGEGADHFLDKTNSLADDGNTCRRSEQAYAFRLAEILDWDATSYACSGATIGDIVTTGQKDNPDADVAGALPQLASALDPALGLQGETPQLILMSAGGNDASFAEVVAGCVLPSDCEKQSGNFLAAARGIVQPLTDAYEAIGTAFPGAQIVAIPYPPYVGSDACDGSLTKVEAAFANAFIEELNTSVATAAANAGDVVFFDGMLAAFTNRTLCDDDRGANFLHLLPRSGPVFERLNPTTWHNGTGHPNAQGYACIAEALATFLATTEAIDVAVPDHEPICDLASEEEADTLSEAIDELEAVFHPVDDATPTTENFDAEEWLGEEISAFTPGALFALLLVLLGGLLFALGVVSDLRGPFVALKPSLVDDADR